MAIPNYQEIITPLLKFAADKQEHTVKDSVAPIAEFFKLTENEKQQRVRNGSKTIIYDRVNWALTYLKQAGLLEAPRRGCFKITDAGLEALKKHQVIDNSILRQYPAFNEFTKRSRKHEDSCSENISTDKQTPEEKIGDAHEQLNQGLIIELLEQLQKVAPAFFEKIVVDVLLKMGYGGNWKDSGRVVGKSGDGGIDGIINEDKLGLDVVYIQAKLWASSVGAKELRDFVGSLEAHKANKGVFITTSDFTKEAKEYKDKISRKVVLINGQYLARLMIEHNVGVNVKDVYEIKKIDLDYFAEE